MTNVSWRCLRTLKAAGNRMTKGQWIMETYTLKKSVLEATEVYVRKTKHHVILINPRLEENYHEHKL